MNALKTAFLLGLLSALIVAMGGLFGGPNGMYIALGIAALMNFFSYWFSDRIVLALHRAQPVGRDQAPELYEILERLTARAVNRSRISKSCGAWSRATGWARYIARTSRSENQ